MAWDARLTATIRSAGLDSHRRELQPDPPRDLYHYTSPIGLKGIIESRTLWASSATFLNDESELTYVDTIVEPIVRELTATSDAGSVREFSERFAQMKLSSFARGFGVFVACFCEEPDLLSQWRGYGQGGFSIGFDTRSWTQPWHADGEQITRLMRVECREEMQDRIIRSVVEPIVKTLTAEEDQHGTDHVIAQRVAPALHVMSDLLWNSAIWFKHPGFSEEKEWRLIVIQDEVRYIPNVTPGPPPLKTFVRTAPFGFVPYVKVPIGTSPRPAIRNILVGPSARPEQACRGAHALIELSEMKSDGIGIYKTNVPLRA
jgi:Protein of unknown function (DUF2971)